ncbi:MAG TPA: galactokinase [Fimbriimonas sp.]|nr:galactokinase [Fimbriimonas sp.]
MSVQQASDLFQKYFGTKPSVVVFAPGRVNLIGEHTDYNGGFVMPCAIEQGVYVAAREAIGETRLISNIAGPGKPYCSMSVEPGEAAGWAKYPAGMTWVLREAFDQPLVNIEAAVFSDLPTGSGLSSSAAIELAFGLVYTSFSPIEVPNKELALLAQKCENQFVGMNCGIMDQMASAMGKAGHAVCLDTRSLDIEYAPIPEGLSIVILDTKKPRALTASAYNERRQQCEDAARQIGVEQLRDATIDQLVGLKGSLPAITFKRARHVITENNRCLAIRPALQAQDKDALFALMKGSHDSLRDDYEVSCAELDAMAEAAWLSPGVVGARMTGAGFGGACVALVESERTEEFIDTCLKLYEQKSGQKGEALQTLAAEGARRLS